MFFLGLSLLLLGVLLSTAGTIWTMILGFMDSALWGLAIFFIPFANLVFIIKKWSNQWVRRSFFVTIGGLGSTIIGAFGMAIGAPQQIANRPNPTSTTITNTPNSPNPTTAPNGVSNGGTATTKPNAPFNNTPITGTKPLAPTTRPPSNNLTTIPGLLPPTDLNKHLAEINSGRSDPFGVLSVKAEIKVPSNQPNTNLIPVSPPNTSNNPNNTPNTTIPTNPNVTRRVPSVSPLRQTNPNRTVASRPNTTNRTVASRPNTTTNRSNIAQANPNNTATPTTTPVAVAPFIPELPELPDPTDAQAISVTGVIEVGGVPQAIIQVSGQPSRYVGAGQRLVNGQVLVKRIDYNQGVNPIVVFEQYGVEVARRVGDVIQPTTSPSRSTPTG